MIEKYVIYQVMKQELKNILKNEPGALEIVLDPYWFQIAVDSVFLSLSRFNESWPILSKSWNEDAIKNQKQILPTDAMPAPMAHDMIAKLAFGYANKRFEQLGMHIRLTPKF